MTPRLTTAMMVSALTRNVANAGGNAAILTRGDAEVGGLLMICAERGQVTALLERVLGSDSRYAWTRVGPDADAREDYLARRRLRDPDLWIVELDIANAERFAAETIGEG